MQDEYFFIILACDARDNSGLASRGASHIGELLNPAAVNTTTHHIVEVGQAP